MGSKLGPDEITAKFGEGDEKDSPLPSAGSAFR